MLQIPLCLFVRFFTPNWASVSCREQGYPWAEAVAGAAQSGLDSTSYIQNSFNPDFCPAVNDGIMPECEKFNSGDAVPEAVAVKCRGRLHNSWCIRSRAE